MFNILRALACFIVGLILVGGAMVPTRIGRIEVASIDPFGLIFLILLGIASRWMKKDYDKFFEWALRHTQWIYQIKSPLKALGWLVFAVYFLLFMAHVFSHLSFHTHHFDMGFVHQALFYPYSGGAWLQADLSPHRSYLVDHFALTLLLLTPLTALFKSNILVFAIQAALVGIGTYWLVVQGPLRKNRSLFIYAALILLSQRSLRNVAVWDFREDIMGFVFLCGALVSLLKGSRFYYFLFLMGFCMSKEHLGIIAFGLVAPIFWDRGLPYSKKERAILAGQTVGLLLVWNVLLFGLIFPTLYAGAKDMSNIATRYPQYGSSPSEVLIKIFTTPWIWWDLLTTKVFVWSSIRYLILLLVPYIFFGWRAWTWFLAPVFGLIANMTSANVLQKSLSFHYEVGWIPFLMVGTLIGIKRVLESHTKEEARKRSLLIGLLIALSFSGRWPLFSVFEYLPTMDQVRDSQFISQTECEQVIGSNHATLPKLTHCAEIRQLLLPGGCSGDPIRALLEQNLSDTSRVPGQSIAQAREMILDQRDACEKTILMALLNRGARTLRVSPTSNYVHIEIPARAISLDPT